jgi:hypothetical protein
MSSFIPENEEDFPQVHSIVDEIFHESFNENMMNALIEHVPTQFEVLENWLDQNRDG